MKLTCNREQFSAKFNLVAAFVAAKDVREVLRDVKMSVKADHVILCATDGETSVRAVLRQGDIVSEGEVIIPARLMKRILQEVKAETIEIELNNGLLEIRSGRAFYQIPTQTAVDFPDIHPFSAAAYHEVKGADLQKGISRTNFATDFENNKYALSGVLFELSEGGIDMVSTDGRRLTHQRGKGTSIGGHVTSSDAIVPLKALGAVEKAIGMTEGESLVKIAIGGGTITFETANEVTVVSQLVGGRFPTWRKIVPDKLDRVQVDLPVDEFYPAVRQAALMTTENQPGVFLTFTPGKLEVSASGDGGGRGQISFPISYDHSEIKIKLDPNFLIDFLRCFPGATNFSVYLKKESSILFETQQDDDYSYVLMPLA